MKIRKLLLAGLMILAPTFAFNKIKAQNLETLTEKYSYNINCITKVGYGNFEYNQTGNDYIIEINAKTNNFFDLMFFGKEYLFKTAGNVSGNEFIPDEYLFRCRDNSFLTEVLQKFDFTNLKVRSIRANIPISANKKIIYDKNTNIDSKTRDILSALMELRENPTKKNNTIRIIEEGIPQNFNIFYEGLERIKINNHYYAAYKLNIADSANTIDGGQEAVLYLDTNQKRTPLRLIIKDYYIGIISVDISN